MNESTTEVFSVPTTAGQDVLTEVLRAGGMLARAMEDELAAWISDHAHLTDNSGGRR
jgi:hypothetical protein